MLPIIVYFSGFGTRFGSTYHHPQHLAPAFILHCPLMFVFQDLAPDLGQRVVITNIWRHLQDDPMEFLPDFQKRRASFSEAPASKPFTVSSTSGIKVYSII